MVKGLTCEEAGRLGGFKRAELLPPWRRKEIAKQASKARWGKYKKEKRGRK